MLNKRLKAKIIERAGTQADFAVLAGEREEEISRVIRGRRSLSLERKSRWARLLKTTVDEIF